MKFWNLKNKHILVIDDQAEMRSQLKNMLQSLMPDSIHVARNGEEAIEFMEKEHVDIVLCDYNLGNGKDGQHVLEEAKHRELINYATVYIMVTAESTTNMVMAAIDYEPDDYLSKPFTKNQLQSRLEKICRKKEELIPISKATDQNNFTQALKLCEKKLAEKSGSKFELLKLKGNLLTRLGLIDDAENYYCSLLEERDLPWAKLALGQVYFQKKQYHEAEEIFKGLIQENTSHVKAYDYLADTLEKLNELDECQTVLQQAIEKSPKSLTRHRKLGDIASKNGDAELAEKAFTEAIEQGKHSCMRNPSDLCGLANSLAKQERLDEALKTVEKIETEYPESDEARLQAATSSAMLHQQNGDKEKCQAELEKAMQLFEKDPSLIDKETALNLTENCLAADMTEKANDVLKHIVSNNIDDKEILDKTMDIYKAAGKDNIGDDILQQTKQEVIRVNNEGAKLLQQGKLEESIAFFIKAVKGMPNNATINMNAAYSMILHMQKTGEVNKYYSRAAHYLEQAHKHDPNNQKYFQLMQKLQSFNSKAA